MHLKQIQVNTAYFEYRVLWYGWYIPRGTLLAMQWTSFLLPFQTEIPPQVIMW